MECVAHATLTTLRHVYGYTPTTSYILYLQILTCIDTILGDLGVLGDDPLGLVVLNCLYSFCGEVIEDEDVVEEEVVGEELLRGGGGELLSVLV